VETVPGERGTDEEEQRAHRLVPIQGLAEKRDADDDGEDGRRYVTLLAMVAGAWRTMWKLSR
jgi:hypothetical protein